MDDVMPESVPIDVHMFKSVLDEKFKVFCERREQYGNHLNNAKRFPQEEFAGIYIKAARIIRDIENGTVKKDTLLDLSNYCDMALAEMEAE